MSDVVVADFYEYGVFVAAMAIALGFSPRAMLAWLVGAIVLIVLHDGISHRLWGVIPELAPFEASLWAWSEKIYSTFFFLLVVAPLLGHRSVGVTLRFERPGALTALIGAGVLIAAFSSIAYFAVPNEQVSLDTLAFQLTMPGLEEELFYRGVLLVMLDRAFGCPLRILGAPFGWGALLSAALFGAAHGISYSDGFASFSIAYFAVTFFSALVFTWFRVRSGNLILPIVLHNFGNAVTFFL